MSNRLPTILGKAIDDAIITLNTQSQEERVVDLARCISRMGELMTDLSGNAILRPIIDDDEAEVALWNKAIAKYFQGIHCSFCPSNCQQTNPPSRERFHERALAFRRGLQVQTTPRVLWCQ